MWEGLGEECVNHNFVSISDYACMHGCRGVGVQSCFVFYLKNERPLCVYIYAYINTLKAIYKSFYVQKNIF